ncbi:MAG: hypothetical protein ACI8PZ_007400 [Myxococcota bacterium]|jgi:hypothetical protein
MFQRDVGQPRPCHVAEQNPCLTGLDEAMKASFLEQARTKGFNTDGC